VAERNKNVMIQQLCIIVLCMYSPNFSHCIVVHRTNQSLLRTLYSVHSAKVFFLYSCKPYNYTQGTLV